MPMRRRNLLAAALLIGASVVVWLLSQFLHSTPPVTDLKRAGSHHGMLLMPWVRAIVRLEKPTAQKACRGYLLWLCG